MGKGVGDTSKGVGMEDEDGKGKDTPDKTRTQIAAPIPEFQESPVTNFLNTLSPIKPTKSVYVTQSFSALHFAHMPVFTSPHVSTRREFRVVSRQQFVEPSILEFSSDTGTQTQAVVGYSQVAHNDSNGQQQQQNPSILEFPSYTGTQTEAVVGYSQVAHNDSNGQQQQQQQQNNIVCTPISGSRAAESALAAEFTSTSGAFVPFGQSTSGEGLHGNELSREEMNQTNGSGDAAGCDSEISETDSLMFDQPVEWYDIVSAMESVQSLSPPVQQGNRNELDNPFTQGMLAGPSQENGIEGSLDDKTDEPVPHSHRGMKRRCLVFEAGGGACSQHFNENSTSLPPILSQERNTSSTNNTQPVPSRSGHDSSRHILPGIGLHLNALATAPKEYTVVKQDSVSGRLVIAPPSSMVNFHSFSTAQEPINNQPLAINSMERAMDPIESAVPVPGDASQASSSMIPEEFNQSSPKNKRRRVEQAASENEGCKRCNCKRSKCLKLYCECFAASVYCVEPCSCQGCFNKPIHEDAVLATRKQIESRNPLAFAPKVIRSSDSLAEAAGDESTNTPASARHKRGCNCKRSNCLKKYCECYQAGVGCSINCRCESCKNAFGKKDGSLFMGHTELEPEVVDKRVEERASHKTTTQNDIQQNPESAVPTTPFHVARPAMQVPFSTKKKPPRSSLATSTGASASSSSQGQVAKTAFLAAPQPKFDKQFVAAAAAVAEDELPQILQTNGSPSSGIKSAASPNSKRVSPPHCASETSPGKRSSSSSSSRKLILKSIPAFPSLTPPKR